MERAMRQTSDERVLICTPTGRDAELARSVLSQAGFTVALCGDVSHLCHEVAAGAGALVVADEALEPAALHLLEEQLHQEPAWSDLPIIILTAGNRAAAEARLLTEEALSAIGNVTLLDRPLRVQTLVSAARAALRARRRQYLCRELLAKQQKTVRRLDLLAEVANDFLLTEKPEDVVGNVFKKIAAQLELDLYVHYLCDSDGQTLALHASHGIAAAPNGDAQTFAAGEPISRAVAESRSPLVAADVQHASDPRFRVARTAGMCACVCFPLVANEQLIGTLLFGTRRRSQFEHEELALLETICHQIAIAIHRKRTEESLYELTHQLDRRVQERTAQLQETSDQMEAFCYSISHDLRAPLRTIRGFSQAILEDYASALDESGRDYLKRVMDGAYKMDALIHDLLEYSRLGRSMLAFEPLDTEVILEKLLLQFEEEVAAKQAEIIVSKPLAKVKGHSPTFEQMLTNLISNALKFVAPDVAPRIRFWTDEQDQMVRLWVEDNGIGIAPEHHARIFGVFERLHGVEVYPGTGIGLAIVAKGAARMGGRAGVQSDLGRGSRFWIELPKA